MTERIIPPDRLYASVAPVYWLYVSLVSLGAFPGLYRHAVDALDVQEGANVLDMCCGTGELFPHLVAKVGPSGRVLGVDASAEMLAIARRRIARAGWRNVAIVQADATRFTPQHVIDGAIFCICLSAIPGYAVVLDRCFSMLGPGRPVVVVDLLLVHDRYWHAFANAYNQVKGLVIGANSACGVRDILRARLSGLIEREIWGGVYLLISGRVRDA